MPRTFEHVVSILLKECGPLTSCSVLATMCLAQQRTADFLSTESSPLTCLDHVRRLLVEVAAGGVHQRDGPPDSRVDQILLLVEVHRSVSKQRRRSVLVFSSSS